MLLLRFFFKFPIDSLENWGLCPVVVLDLKVGEEDDGGVRCKEDEDVPRPMQVGETHACPPKNQINVEMLIASTDLEEFPLVLLLLEHLRF